MSRRNRLRQGAEAKERVLSGAYNQPRQSVPAPSRRDRLKAPEVIADMNLKERSGIDNSVRAMAPELFNPQQNLDAFDKMVQPSRPMFGPPVPKEVGAAQRQASAKASPLTRFGEGIAKFADDIVPGSFGNKPIKRPIESLSSIPDIPGITTANPVTNFIRGAGDTATLGLSSYADRMMGNVDAAEGATQTGAGRAGQIAGGFVLPAGRIKAGASLVGNIARGAGAGALLGTGIEAGEMATGRNNQTLGQRALDIGISSALGGAGSGVVAGIGKLARRGVKSQPSVDVPPQSRPMDIPEQGPSAEPMKQNWFTNLFGNQGMGISAFNSGRRLGNKPLSTKDAIVGKSIKDDKEGLKAEASAYLRSGYQNFVDALSPLKKINNETYETAMDAARANNIANNIVGKDFVTPEGIRIGDGMETIFKKVGRGQDKEFIDYLVLRDAETRVGRGERVYDESLGMTTEKIAERIKMYNGRYPGFQAIAKDWDSFTKNLRETFGVNEGLITKEQSEAMKASRPFYIKMQRQFSRSEKPGRKWLQGSSSSAFSGQKAPIKKVSPTGSVKDIVDPRKTMIEAVGLWANSAMRNRAMQEVVKQIRLNPESLKGVAEIVPETAEVAQKSLKEINGILESDGVEGLLEQLNGDFELAFKKGAQKGNEDNIVRAMVDGQPVRIRIHDPEVIKALTAMGPQSSGIVVDLLTMFSNATKRGATGALAPLFAARSVTTDLVQSIIQSKNPAQHGVDLVHAVFSSMGDKFGVPGLNKLAKEFRMAGGEYSAALRGERQLNKSLGRLKRDPILSPQNLGRQTLRTLAAPFKLGEAISDVSENINRIAAYKGEMRRLGGERTPENVRKAITEAREITTNFSRKGALSRELEAAFPYQNAAVQGTYRVMRGFKQHPIKTTAAVFTLAIAPKLMEYAQFHDDPDYQKLPARERMRNMIISKNNDGTFVKIPMEPSYNSFGEMTIRTLSYLKDNDPEAFKGTLDALANAWTPPILTGALQGATQGTGIEGSAGGLLNSMSPAPILGATYNQSFTGAPIVPKRLEGRSDKNQFDERTSGPAKWIGEKLKMAPMKVDYLLRAYGGDPARLLLPLTSDLGAGTQRNTLLKNFIVDPEFTNTLSDDFYSAQERFTNAKADLEVGDPLPEWYSESLDKLVTSRAKGMPARKLSDLNEQKRAITGDRSLNAEKKAQQLRDIQEKINQIYLDVNSQLVAAGVPMPRR